MLGLDGSRCSILRWGERETRTQSPTEKKNNSPRTQSCCWLLLCCLGPRVGPMCQTAFRTCLFQFQFFVVLIKTWFSIFWLSAAFFSIYFFI
jgi:hypothetical protein